MASSRAMLALASARRLPRCVDIRPAVRCFSSGRLEPSGPLAGVKILDLSRILAGPSATMLLADMGATVIKVERPGVGDDTRRYAPPYLEKNDKEDSDLAAYFSSCNRNKQSVALNFTKKEGLEVIHRLLADTDIVIENFKTGTLNKYGLGYDALAKQYPGLIYCSITGFGQTGPYRKRPAYDMLIQAMGGSMSITGVPDGEPMKMGLSMFDLTAGLHACIGILAALRDKSLSGLGQHVDISMLDVSVALLQNQGMNFLAHKQRQARVGNNHPNVVPYQVMPTQDGFFILTASNDEQFINFLKVADRMDLMEDDRFNTMKARVVNRPHVTPALNEITKTQPTAWWLEKLGEMGVGCAPILHLDEVFEDPHVQARGMEIKMRPPGCEKPVSLIGSPMKFSRTKVNYRIPPVRCGEHTDEVLTSVGYSTAELAKLREAGAVGEQPEPIPGWTEGEAVTLDEQVEEITKAPAELFPAGSSWDKIRSVSVPQAAGYVKDGDVPQPPGEDLPPSKLKGKKLSVWLGSTWDSVRSMSVPNAAAYVGEDKKPKEDAK